MRAGFKSLKVALNCCTPWALPLDVCSVSETDSGVAQCLFS